MRAAQRAVARRKISAPFSSLLSPFVASPETEISYLNQASPVNWGKKDVK